jgi:hypothetical protein
MKLQWRQLSATRMASTCSRYVIERKTCHDNYPATEYRYVAKRANGQVVRSEPFKTFPLAASACEVDLTMQQTQKG